MGKSLDDIFRENLKGQDQLPEGIGFNSERIKDKLDLQLQKPKKKRKWFTAVLLLLLFGSSGLNIIQYNQRSEQNTIVIQKENEDSLTGKESLAKNDVDEFKPVKNVEQDSLTELQRVAYIPQVIPTKEVRFQIVHHIHPIQKIDVSTQKAMVNESIIDDIKNEKTSDLPVFYESDELALEVESRSGRNKFKKRNSFKQLN